MEVKQKVKKVDKNNCGTIENEKIYHQKSTWRNPGAFCVEKTKQGTAKMLCSVHVKENKPACRKRTVAKRKNLYVWIREGIMLKPDEILISVKEIADFLIQTQDKYNQELALYLMRILDNEPLKNYVNFNEASLVTASFGEFGLTKKCIDIAEYEISLVSGCLWEKNHYAFMSAAVELVKAKALEDVRKPSLKDKYLYALEFTNGTVKIGITKEKEKRMKAISSASGMNITRSYFTEKIEQVQNLETELHRYFKDKRLNGEFFDIDFEEAVTQIKKRADHRD